MKVSPESGQDDSQQVVLKLPTDPGLLVATVDFVGSYAYHHGLGHRAVGELRLAVGEALANVLGHAFRPQEHGRYEVVCQRVPGGVEILVRDHGLPYQPELAEPKQGQRGFAIMGQHVDRLTFATLGQRGKELRLLKLYPRQSSWTKVEAPRFDPESFTAEQLVVRDMEPGDAIEVSRCFYEVYGYDYGSDTVYDPKRLLELQRAGLLKTLVAVTPEGSVLGTQSLERSEITHRIWEASMMAVRPEARQFGVAGAMSRTMEAFVLREKLLGVWGCCVTSHTFSQKTLPRAARACLLTPGNKKPDRTLAVPQTQRNSALYLYLCLHQEPPTPTVYLPPKHEAICREIFENFGWQPNYASADVIPPMPEITRANYDTNHERGRVVGHVFEYGTNFERRGRERHNIFRTSELSAIYVFLPMDHPFLLQACDILESWGYFFNGIFPGTGHDDPRLVMGYLINQILDYDQIHILDEFGLRLRDYIRSQDPEQKSR
jgi:serine/threonine-protein kinase RsbW